MPVLADPPEPTADAAPSAPERTGRRDERGPARGPVRGAALVEP